MTTVLLTILKIIGIVLLVILGIMLFLLAVLLFVPVRYSVKGTPDLRHRGIHQRHSS